MVPGVIQLTTKHSDMQTKYIIFGNISIQPKYQN
jgi:hypothetical protein